jgi:YkoY family integral membrane protein
LFSQTFEIHDIFVVLILVVLEGVLSIDNALVLGLLARRLPESQRAKALSYGLIGALIFRIVAIFLAGWMLRWNFVKLIGGGYLIYLAGKHLLFSKKAKHGKQHGQPGEEGSAPEAPAQFWPTVAAVELTDVAFAVDSILAAVALVADEKIPQSGKLHPKLWVIITGGMIGVLLVRVAAALFVKLLDRFPRFETAAYLLVLLIGAKLIVDWIFNAPGQEARVDFSSPHAVAFWVFWVGMAACFCVGFLPSRVAITAPKSN